MNILLISDVYLPTVSGVAASTDSIAKFLASQGHTVYLVCPKPNNPIAQDVKRLHIIYTPSVSDPFFVGKRMAIIPLGFREIWQTISTHNIDIAHIQEPGALGVMALICCRLRQIPTVGALHTSMEQVRLLVSPIFRPLVPSLMSVYIHMIYPHYNAVMVPTQTVVKFLRPILGKNKEIQAVSNGVNTEEFIPLQNNEALRKSLHTPKNKILFLHVGRLDVDKNIDTMLRALTHTGPDIHFLLAGIGKQEAALRAYANKLGINDKITWIGRVDRSTMVQWYQVADAFMIMSPVETQSIVALQAISTGLPLIVANAGALPELVHDGKNGFLVETYDDEALAAKMELLAHDPKLRVQMAKESRTISLPHHKPVALSELTKLYQRVLA